MKKRSKNKQVITHLRDDIKNFKHEAEEDRKLINDLKKKSAKKKSSDKKGKKDKIGKVMNEYKKGELHSGSKKGPKVTSRKQAVAIALSEARKAGKKKKKSK